MHNCTTEDLLLYLDDDLPAVERSNIAAMLQDNWALREKLQVLQEAKEQLNSAPLQAPKQKSLQNVLNHLYKTHNKEKLTYATLYTKPAADIR